MESATTMTMIKILETIPKELQEQVVEHMRYYIEDILEETKWNESFSKSQNKLVAAARKARKEIKEGKAVPLSQDAL
ncbi:MAG: hypothetical protein U9R02_03920 [Thermodesulfobacteriota bacterium]|nr:hypothetical protein [Thermodesulfobacteriota bacterium]